jgi:hypothetical protein
MRACRPIVLVGAALLAAGCAFPDLQYVGGDGGDDGPSGHDATSAEGGADATNDVFAVDGGADSTVGDGGEAGSEAGAEAGADGPASTDAADASDTGATSETGADGAPDTGPDAATDGGGDAAPVDSGHDAGGDSGPDAAVNCDQDLDTYHAEGGTCGGNDCCDTDNKVHPGQTAFFPSANNCGSFDYNCNGKNDPQYAISISCGGTGALGCTGGPGYMTDPGCGNPGTYYQCVPNGALACKPGSPVTQVQGCN